MKKIITIFTLFLTTSCSHMFKKQGNSLVNAYIESNISIVHDINNLTTCDTEKLYDKWELDVVKSSGIIEIKYGKNSETFKLNDSLLTLLK